MKNYRKFTVILALFAVMIIAIWMKARSEVQLRLADAVFLGSLIYFGGQSVIDVFEKRLFGAHRGGGSAEPSTGARSPGSAPVAPERPEV